MSCASAGAGMGWCRAGRTSSVWSPIYCPTAVALKSVQDAEQADGSDQAEWPTVAYQVPGRPGRSPPSPLIRHRIDGIGRSLVVLFSYGITIEPVNPKDEESSLDTCVEKVFSHEDQSKEVQMRPQKVQAEPSPEQMRLTPSTMPGLQAVVDADEDWFLANPDRRYRMRPVAIAELPPGTVLEPGEKMIVVRCGSPYVRLRLPIGCQPPLLDEDTDSCCRFIVTSLDIMGHLINGRPVLDLIDEMTRDGRHAPAPKPMRAGDSDQSYLLSVSMA